MRAYEVTLLDLEISLLIRYGLKVNGLFTPRGTSVDLGPRFASRGYKFETALSFWGYIVVYPAFLWAWRD